MESVLLTSSAASVAARRALLCIAPASARVCSGAAPSSRPEAARGWLQPKVARGGRLVGGRQ
eukprot:2462282-Alexandrium_andersonii.AAC.1